MKSALCSIRSQTLPSANIRNDNTIFHIITHDFIEVNDFPSYTTYCIMNALGKGGEPRVEWHKEPSHQNLSGTIAFAIRLLIKCHRVDFGRWVNRRSYQTKSWTRRTLFYLEKLEARANMNWKTQIRVSVLALTRNQHPRTSDAKTPLSHSPNIILPSGERVVNKTRERRAPPMTAKTRVCG